MLASATRSMPAATGHAEPKTACALRVGAVVIDLANARAYRADEGREEGPRLGNIIMLNLCGGVALLFLLGILSEQLSTKFYLAVALFVFLALAALDDVLRSRGLRLFRLYIVRDSGEKLALVTPDIAVLRAVAAELDRRRLPLVD